MPPFDPLDDEVLAAVQALKLVVHYNITYVQFEGDKKINDWGSSTLSPLTQWNSSASSSYLLFLWI